MLDSIVPYLKFHLRLMVLLSICPFEWRQGNPYPTPVKPKKMIYDYRVNLFINYFYGIIMAGNYLWTRNGLNSTKQIMAMMFIFASICSATFRVNFVWKEKELIHLLVFFVRFDKRRHLRGVPVAHGQFLTEFIALFGIITAPPVVVLASTLLFAKPCMAPTLEYILLGGESTCRHLSLWLRIPIILFDAYMWLTNISMTVFYTIQCCFGMMRSLEVYLRSVKPMLAGDSAEDYRQGMRQYRQIQLMGGIFNDTYQSLFFPSLMLATCIVFVFGLYPCVKLHNQIDMPEFALFPLLFVDSLVASFIVKVGANVLKQSERCLEVARNNQKFGRKLLFKRMIRSMGKIRVKFGSTNFVDQLSPFNLLNHGLNICINLMLLS